MQKAEKIKWLEIYIDIGMMEKQTRERKTVAPEKEEITKSKKPRVRMISIKTCSIQKKYLQNKVIKWKGSVNKVRKVIIPIKIFENILSLIIGGKSWS